MDILAQTLRKEGFFALYKGASRAFNPFLCSYGVPAGMASPLIGIAGVNSLLFAAYGVSKRLISPFPQLSLQEIALAGAMAGAANAVLASPGESPCFSLSAWGAGAREQAAEVDGALQSRCSRCACRASTVRLETNACARWPVRCGGTGASGRASCAGTGSPLHERFLRMQGECSS